jgi:hypothetical protein
MPAGSQQHSSSSSSMPVNRPPAISLATLDLKGFNSENNKYVRSFQSVFKTSLNAERVAAALSPRLLLLLLLLPLHPCLPPALATPHQPVVPFHRRQGRCLPVSCSYHH